jgi:hypothetical protein
MTDYRPSTGHDPATEELSLVGGPAAPQPLSLDRSVVEQAVLVARARDELAALRLGSWPVAQRRLVLRLRPDPDAHRSEGADRGDGRSARTGVPLTVPRLGLAPGLIAVPAVLLDHGVATVDSVQLAAWAQPADAVLAAARVNTRCQPLQRLTTTVLDGPDAGARLTVITGGPATSGLVVDLDRVMPLAGGAPPLVVWPSDQVLVVAEPPPRSGPWVEMSLADRLLALTRIDRGGGPGEESHRDHPPPVYRFRGPGRLGIFEPEDRD